MLKQLQPLKNSIGNIFKDKVKIEALLLCAFSKIWSSFILSTAKIAIFESRDPEAIM